MNTLPPVGSQVIFNKNMEPNTRDCWPWLPSGDLKVSIVGYVKNRLGLNVAVFILDSWESREYSVTGTAMPCMFKPILPKTPQQDNAIIYHYRTKNMTRGGLTVYWKDGYAGVAKCSMDDVFCKKTGVEVAKRCWEDNPITVLSTPRKDMSFLLHLMAVGGMHTSNLIYKYLKERVK